MNDKTLREAVARAICRNVTLSEKEYRQWYVAADAAIATMFERLRTPSEGMIEAGSEIGAASIWQAMLAAFQQENSDAD